MKLSDVIEEVGLPVYCVLGCPCKCELIVGAYHENRKDSYYVSSCLSNNKTDDELYKTIITSGELVVYYEALNEKYLQNEEFNKKFISTCDE